MARIFVTGGSGFIGAAIAENLARRGDEIAAFDIAEGPALKRLREQYRNVSFFPGELTEWPQLAEAMKASRPDAVIHCAAVVGIVNSLTSPLYTMRVNVEGSLNVLSAMRLLDVPRMINLSSEEVYGPFQADTIDEGHPCFPVQPYGISKFAVEQLARDFARANGKTVINIRTCWVYGPELPRPRIPKTFLDAAIEGRRLHVAGGADYRVDQIYIDDLVQGIVKALDHREHEHDTYHITTGVALSLGEMVEIIRELVPGADIAISAGDYEVAPGIVAVRKGALDCNRAHKAFGYLPRFSMRDGFAAYIAAKRSS
ncbi:NAD-dependent epimerase/dehydratase family protein [Microvirga sp. G4-2]|uniref:NAD-dependent epimerase/dehydratase family protein n=1 Tax=Microvirga sp. G4-2 TaxID=3434467 RepID=UPI004044BAEB